MSITRLTNWLRQSRTAKSNARRTADARLRTERLEERDAPAIYTVTWDGTGVQPVGTLSLQQAINAANGTPGVPDIINFSGVTTVEVDSKLGGPGLLPDITDSVTIDGLISGTTIVTVNLASSAPADSVPGFVVNAPNSTIQNLAITDLGGLLGGTEWGVKVVAAGGNFRMQHVTITNLVGDGVIISNSPNNTIGGLGAAQFVSIGDAGPNNGNGVHIIGASSTGNVIQQTTIKGNFGDGILIDTGAGKTTIGAAGAAATNTITQNFGSGIHLNSSSGNTIQNTLIGNDGTNGFGNALDGVLVENNSDNNIIGGADLTLANTISGNTLSGIHIKDATSSGNQIQSNLIGLNLAGDTAIPNQGNGVLVENAPGTLVGSTATASTFIAGNGLNGVSIVGASAAGTIVANTRIGLAVAGDVKIGNGLDGVAVSGGATNITIGGSGAKANNVIGGNRNGIAVTGSNLVTIQGNQVGLNLVGAAFPSVGNTGDGIVIDSSSKIQIGGTLAGAGNNIAGNTIGVNIRNASNLVTLQANFIGTNFAGDSSKTQPVPNSDDGVVVDNSTNIVIGTPGGAGGGNLISRNRHGINIRNGSKNVTVQNNRIGTQNNITAIPDLGNSDDGIGVDGSSFVTIGGTAAQTGNTIAKNADGIQISGGSSNVTVQGNLIRNNAGSGVRIEASSGNLIGGEAATAKNIIANTLKYAGGFFQQDGVLIVSGSSNNVVQNNLIGTDGSGNQTFGNRGNGVLIQGASNNVIGGTKHLATDGVEDGNVIAYNFKNGIAVVEDQSINPAIPANGNQLLGNSIFSNGSFKNPGLGINLNTVAGFVDPNDPGDPDAGANHTQNFPVISKADVIGSTTQIVYSLNSTPGHTYRVEFFASDTANQSGIPGEFGQGKVYLGFATVTTNGTGDTGNLTFTASQGLAPLSVVTATATDMGVTGGPLALSDTSEFSQAFYVNTPGPNTYVVNNDGGFYTTLGNPNLTVLNGTMTLARAITLANQHPGTDRIFFALRPQVTVGTATTGATTFTAVADSRTVLMDANLPDITDTVVIDGSHLAWPQNPVNVPFPGAPADGGDAKDYTMWFRNASNGFVISDNQLAADFALNPTANAKLSILRNFPEITGTNGVGVTISNHKGNAGGANLQNIQNPGSLTGLGGINGFALGAVLISNSPDNIVGGAGAGQGVTINKISTGNGVYITGAQSTNNLVQQTKIGNVFGVASDGIRIDGGASGNIIGGFTSSPVNTGNMIVQSNKNGIHIVNSNGNRIQRNFIGNDGANLAMPNAQDGVLIEDSSDNLVGGQNAAAGNLISGNTENGIHVTGKTSNNTQIESNTIGLNAAGDTGLPNSGNGVLIEDAPNTQVGSTTTAANFISGNNLHGVAILGQGAAGSIVVNNRIGIVFTLDKKLGNVEDGVFIGGGSKITVGGAGTNAFNIIGGNDHGVTVDVDPRDGTTKSTGITIKGNRLGMNKKADGTYPNIGNIKDGIFVSQASGVQIGGTQSLEGNNIGSNRNGVYISNSDGVTLQGNFIGPNLTGTIIPITKGLVENFEPVFQAEDGVLVEGSTNVAVGTPAQGGGNLLSHNRHGVSVTKGSSKVTIQNNLIGTQAANAPTKFDLGNQDDGIFIDASNHVLIGGTGPLNANTIAKNLDGIQISGGSSFVTVQQNLIRNNNQSGVRIEGSFNNTIGGNTATAKNLIINRRLSPIIDTTFEVDGVFVVAGPVAGVQTSSTGNVIQGNFLGTDSTTTASNLFLVGNGVLIDGSNNNTVGITTDLTGLSQSAAAAIAANEGNVIGFNAFNGIAVVENSNGPGSANGNHLTGNSIFNNNRLGINLNTTAGTVNLNDLGDPDLGANKTQNFPVIVHAQSQSGLGTQIQYTLNSLPLHNYRIEFFHTATANTTGTPPNYGQARDFAGFVDVSTDATGNVAGTFTNSGVLFNAAEFITATATDLGTGDTSEFALDQAIEGAPGPITYVVNNDGGYTPTIPAPNPPPFNIPPQGTMTLALAIRLSNEHPGPDRIVFAIPPAYTINSSGTITYLTEVRHLFTNGDLPDITDTVIIDGSPFAWPQIKGGNTDFTTSYDFIFNKGSHGLRISDTPTAASLFSNPNAQAGQVVLRHFTMNTSTQNTNIPGPGIEIATKFGNANIQDVAISGFGGDGVRITNSPNNIVGGSGAQQSVTIRSVGGSGVNILGAASTGNLVQQTNIGFPVSPSGSGGAGGNGIWIQSANNNTVGGFVAGTGVIIQGSGANGIYVINSNGTRIQRSTIGDAATNVAPNHFDGIRIEDSLNTLIGGVTAAAGNTIAGNTEHGIHAVFNPTFPSFTTPSGLQIQSNKIGSSTAPNSGNGIFIDNVPNVLIGSTVTAANTIDGNNLNGILIQGTNSAGARITNTSVGSGGGNILDGIVINGVSDVVIGGIGANAGGTVAGNRRGISLLGASKVNIQQYTVSNNSEEGIRVDNSTAVLIGGSTSASAGNKITGNKTGVQTLNFSDGITLQGNTITSQSEDGVVIDSTGHVVVGSPIQFGGNLIGGNRNGVRVLNGSTNFKIENNVIGGVGTTTGIAGNTDDGVLLDGITGATVGGTSALSGNWLGGNKNGLDLADGTIGTTVYQNAFVNSGETGILLQGSSFNIIGGNKHFGLVGAKGNLVSANTLFGILLKPDFSNPSLPIFSNSNVIQGNFVGVDQTGKGAFGNGVAGIFVDSGSDNLIGGTNHNPSLNIEEGNTVANTVNGSGVVVSQDNALDITTQGVRNSILGNSIFNNNGLGIELGSNVGQVHDNDPQDPDVGPNNLQNFPQVDQAQVGLVSAVASGVFNSTPGHHYRLEFFGSPTANTTGSPTGFGQGQTYLGFTEVDTDANGDASWSFFGPVTFQAGGVVSGTATDMGVTGGPLAFGDTSEFGKATTVTQAVGKIEGFKFEDLNGNGIFDAGEPGLSGWTIELRVADQFGVFPTKASATTTTDAAGHYQFANLTDGTYSLAEVQKGGWVQTAAPVPNPVQITGGATLSDNDFGNFHMVKVTGHKFQDTNGNGVQDAGEGPIAGVTMNLIDAKTNKIYMTTQTDLSGNFAFNNLFIGKFGATDTGFYRVREVVPTGFTQTTANPADFQIVSGQDVGPLNFGNKPTGGGGGGVPNPIDYIIAGSGPGSIGTVHVYKTKGLSQVFSLVPYGTTFTGGVHVAKGDVNGDKQQDIIVAPGAGTSPLVKVYDGTSGKLMKQFMAFDPTIKSGVWVAAGDVNGDGVADIVTGLQGVKPEVRVFDGKSGIQLIDFFAIDKATPTSPWFTGGIRVAVGDVNGDGFGDIITAPGKGAQPIVKVWDGANIGTLGTTTLIRQFTAFETTFTGGLFVAAGNINGDNFADVIVGPDAGRRADVKVFDGATGKMLSTFVAAGDPTKPSQVFSDPAWNAGVHVANVDLDGDGLDDVLTGPGMIRSPHIRGYNPRTGVKLVDFMPFPSTFLGGVFVA